MTNDDEMMRLAEHPVTRSVVEEALALLWAILATITPITALAIFAWIMAALSAAGAIYFAARPHFRNKEGSR
jgi:heme O synthase-like polyprenyltransferase